MKKINFYLSIMYYIFHTYITGISRPDSIKRNSATGSGMRKLWKNVIEYC